MLQKKEDMQGNKGSPEEVKSHITKLLFIAINSRDSDWKDNVGIQELDMMIPNQLSDFSCDLAFDPLQQSSNSLKMLIISNKY